MHPSAQSRAVPVDRHEPARGVMNAVVLGAVLWTALIAALRWLVA